MQLRAMWLLPLLLASTGAYGAAELPPSKPGAAEPPESESAGRRFRSLDTNGNGVISLDEALEFQRYRFRLMDRNGDGRITLREMVEAGGGRPSEAPTRFAKIDTNGDGGIDLMELSAPATRRFRIVDTDGNGVLDADELNATPRP